MPVTTVVDFKTAQNGAKKLRKLDEPTPHIHRIYTCARLAIVIYLRDCLVLASLLQRNSRAS